MLIDIQKIHVGGGHFLMSDKMQGLGFENLSHFSYLRANMFPLAQMLLAVHPLHPPLQWRHFSTTEEFSSLRIYQIYSGRSRSMPGVGEGLPQVDVINFKFREI